MVRLGPGCPDGWEPVDALLMTNQLPTNIINSLECHLMSGETSKSPFPEGISEQESENGGSQKKMPEMKVKRSLVNHDLDQLLVYTKRQRKTPVPDPPARVEKPKLLGKKSVQDRLKVITKIKTGVEKQPIQSKQQLVSYHHIKDQNLSTQIKFDLMKYQEKKQKESDREKEKDTVQEEKKTPKLLPENTLLAKTQSSQDMMGEKEKSLIGQNFKKEKVKRKPKVVYRDSEESSEGEEFPYTNEFFQNIQEEHLQFLQECEGIKQETEGQHALASKSFVNCDVRYFNWNFFAQKVGSFDVVLIDPPWRIKGAQQNDSQFMFSNCKFSLEYNTMSNGDIETIQIEKLSKCGFIFVWILNTQLGSSLEVMNKWGYELVDILVWVKMRKNKVFLTNGFYFMHSYEMCLIGYKSHPDMRVETANFISNNVLFAEVRRKSQKPDELYHMIEMMFPTNKKIEVFARNNNLRFGWFSLGNELGESYDKWLVSINCDRCKIQIVPKVKRFKSRFKVNFDLCQKCIKEQEKDQFLSIENQVDQNVIHLYQSCNHCKSEPIWGNRFECLTCSNYDLCQVCFDQNLHLQKPFHDVNHDIKVIEIPVFGEGFQVHDMKCSGCFQKPIIGVSFTCTVCKSFNLCQKCFFATPDTDFKRHTEDHPMEARFEPALSLYRRFQCFSCTKQISQHCHMCQNCYNFFFCEDCYSIRDQFKTNMANNHKDYHKFVKIF